MWTSLSVVALVGLAQSGVAALSAARGSTRFFLDTADRQEYASLLPLGIFHGVTTNPTILARCGVPCSVPAIDALAKTAFDHGVEEFMCQVAHAATSCTATHA